mgnify:CR=1 FL=1
MYFTNRQMFEFLDKQRQLSGISAFIGEFAITAKAPRMINLTFPKMINLPFDIT